MSLSSKPVTSEYLAGQPERDNENGFGTAPTSAEKLDQRLHTIADSLAISVRYDVKDVVDMYFEANGITVED